MAAEEDLLREQDGNKRLCELVDGVLVEKPLATYESRLAFVLAAMLETFLYETGLGIGLGEAGFLRLAFGLVRAPDVSFISWERFPGRKRPPDRIFRVAPDLAVEILSRPTPSER